MKETKWMITLLVLATIAYVVYDKKKTNKPDSTIQENKPKVEIKKRFNEKGRLEADAETLNGVHHGVSHNYYSDGAVHSEIHYLNGMKQGNSIWYYQSGKQYRVTPYLNDNKNGIQQKFYEDGTLMAEIPYRNDTLLPGTKEYTTKGKLITDYPSYSVQANFHPDRKNIIRLIVTGKKVKRIKYLTVFIGTETYLVKTPVNISTNEVQYFIETGNSCSQHAFVCLIAFKTDLNHLKAVEQTLSL